ncbi:MAG TPA: hypothetical protein VK601_00050 [Kofleriaceae bacterium]|nr:hypothetical protein [Kofleriaceae bacterium]
MERCVIHAARERLAGRIRRSIPDSQAFCTASNSGSKNSVRRSSARSSAPAQASNQGVVAGDVDVEELQLVIWNTHVE